MLSSDPLQHIDQRLTLPSGQACHLRNFHHDDISAIVANEHRASDSPWSQASFRSSIDCSHICVGLLIENENVNEWLAHAVFSLAGGEAELLILAVNPTWQGRKVATTLLVSMEGIISSRAEQVFLEVRQSNFAAIHLYESLGFCCLGERPHYYPPIAPKTHKRETALIYAKDISLAFSGEEGGL